VTPGSEDRSLDEYDLGRSKCPAAAVVHLRLLLVDVVVDLERLRDTETSQHMDIHIVSYCQEANVVQEHCVGA